MPCQICFCNSFDYYLAQGFKHLCPTGLEFLVIENAAFKLVLSLQGGQLLECYRKSDQCQLLWLSPLNRFSRGEPIRGGIPLCFPWFGVKQNNPSASKHGFVRTQDWVLKELKLDDDTVALELSIEQTDTPGNPVDYPYPFVLQHRITLSHTGLDLTLAMHNSSSTAVEISWAWHSYFATQAQAVKVEGLDQLPYLDNTAGLALKQQQGDVRFEQEVDRVYQTACDSTQRLIWSEREIAVSASAPSCIVWNPGSSLASKMPDVDAGYRDFVCLERGCAFDETLKLDAKASYQAQMQIVF